MQCHLKVQLENNSALDFSWSLYTDGTLRESLQASLVTDEVKELAGGEQVEVIVTIDEQEYDKAREELISEAQGDFFFFVLTLTQGWYLIKVSVTSSLKPEKWQFIVNYWVAQLVVNLSSTKIGKIKKSKLKPVR